MKNLEKIYKDIEINFIINYIVMGKFKVWDRVIIARDWSDNHSWHIAWYTFVIEEVKIFDNWNIFYREREWISEWVKENLLELVNPLGTTWDVTPTTLWTGIGIGDCLYGSWDISWNYSNTKWCLDNIDDKILDEIIEKYWDKIKEKMWVLDVKNYIEYFDNQIWSQDYQDKLLQTNNKQMNKLQEKLFDRFLKSNETKIIETTEKLEEKLELLNNIYLFLNSRKDEIKKAKSNLEESFERQDKDYIKTYTKEWNELLKKLDDPLYEQILTIVESLKD